ncbi:hypothetical protein C2S51_029913 [Perilla frutescens var. frutescens]|nr:hypothetical protein C2S51_029913 [Perilla frutescens var. frutescens]
MDGFDSREASVFLAKMAERARRYDDMVEAMNVVAKMNVELTAEERRLLSDGLKHAVVERRNAGIILSAMEKEEGGVNVERIQEYKWQVEEEIVKICVAAKVGDCYKCWAEFKAAEGKRLHASHETSLALYEIAEEELHPANHTRLQLALNFSVLFWDILFKPKRAFEMAQRAIHEGCSGMGTLKEESQRAASMEVMELLRGNMYMWTRMLISGGSATTMLG